MTTNNKISHTIAQNLPFFVRNDHPGFIAFLEAYYEFLEQSETTLADGQVVDRAKNLPAYKDIDSTIDEFSDRLYEKFLDGFPVNTLGNRALIMKHIKDFYRAKGTEKSYRFLMRALYGKEVEFYYPKEDVLRTSDGKWYIQKAIRVVNTTINGVANNNINGLELYINRQITGNTSGATATIESIDRYYTSGSQIDELTISNIVGTFESEEGISTSFTADSATYNVNSTIIGSVVNTVTITTPGLGYETGDPVIVLSSTGTGACVTVGTVTSGNVSSITVVQGGAGYRVNDYLLITSDTGSGANGYISLVNTDQTVHPNTYNIWMSTIDLESNTPINNISYSNLNASVVDPANNWLQNTWSNFVYSNTGPATIITMSSSGSGYETLPTISILANTRVLELGILGRMNVVNSGSGYAVGDIIEFINVPSGYGVGAQANVKTVNGSGGITAVQFDLVGGHLVGGSGYDINYLPRANVINTLGSGVNANVVVTQLLGTGGTFSATNSSIGAIQTLRIISGGSNYTTVPTLDLTGSGDGTAEAVATILSGVFTYPGRYLNDDGQLSSYNFLQDRDYYQNFSYVIRVKKSIADYRKVLKDLVHPAGMKLFGEYMELDENQTLDVVQNDPVERVIKFNTGTYTTSNSLNIFYTDHGLAQNDNVYLEFTSGNLSYLLANGIYMISAVENANRFSVYAGMRTSYRSNFQSISTSTTDVKLHPNGSYIITVNTSSEKLRRRKLNTPWDLSTITGAATAGSNALVGPVGNPQGFDISPDGSNVYAVGTTQANSNTIWQFTMNSWNVQTMAGPTAEYTIDALNKLGFSIRVRPEGNTIYILGRQSGILQYNMANNWNINTASFVTSYNSYTHSTSMTGMTFDPYGTRMYLSSSGDLHQFALSSPWNVNTAVWQANTRVTSFQASVEGIDIHPDGDIVYITSGTYQFQLPLDTKWAINSARFDITTGNVSLGRIVS